MNETLYYEPEVEYQVVEFDCQIPEYINPDWDDDVLYNLICANQDVLVEFDGSTMTLSAAMNQHPGPWIPENEANLIAYAEGLLATAPIEPLVSEQEVLEQTESQPTLDQPQLEDPPIQKVTQHAQVKNTPEKSDQQEENVPQPQLETSLVSPKLTTRVHADIHTTIATRKIVNDQVEHERNLETVDQHISPEISADTIEQVRDTLQPIEVEETQGCEASSSETHIVPEITEAVKAVYEESETMIDAVEPDEIRESANEVVDDEPLEQQVFDDEHEPTYSLYELSTVELPLEPQADHAPDTVIPDQLDTVEPDQLGLINVTVEEVESAVMQLTEQLWSNESEGNEKIDDVTAKILEATISFEVETKEEYGMLYVELFEAAGIAYSPELIESLAELSIKWNLIDEIESLNSAEYDTPSDENEKTRRLVRKLLVAIASIMQAIRHVYAIGTYALRLYLAPTVVYR